MLPKISQAPGVAPAVTEFLDQLKQQGFTGDTATGYADRLTMTTDNNIFQLLPDAVVFPRSSADMVLIGRLAEQPPFTSLNATPRGGGTGTNGQSLNRGVVVDVSRYMNHILEVNAEQGWVRVEAGVIKDQLNQFLKPLGYFFSPELSTSNRATLGGMINTDASGQGSLVYGKTSNHMLDLRAVLMGGDLLDTRAMPIAAAEVLAAEQSQTGAIYRTVLERCREQRQLIMAKFPNLNRFRTGYDLRHVFSDDMQTFNLTRNLTGSEGTLAFIPEATLDITPLPKVRRLVNVKYDYFDSALRNAAFMLEAHALSVETVDSNVLNLAREDIVWHSVRELIEDVSGQAMQGLNIVAFAGDDLTLIEQQLASLCAGLDRLMAAGADGVVRPALDMCDPAQEVLMKQLSDQIVALTAKYGGLLWGEHGKGFRAEYSPAFFGEVLYSELRRIKAAFDPANRLNTGKIFSPPDSDAPMLTVDAAKRGTYDRKIPVSVRGDWRGAMECNGNGLYFNFDTRSPMCPSMKISGDRIHSPKGRAALVRKWLRLLAQQLPWGAATLCDLAGRVRNSWRARRGNYDFFHEVKAAMSGCLACKACSTQCPVKIDVPGFRLRFRQLYPSRYLRPVRDHLVAGVEQYKPLMARSPATFNFFFKHPWLSTLSQ